MSPKLLSFNVFHRWEGESMDIAVHNYEAMDAKVTGKL